MSGSLPARDDIEVSGARVSELLPAVARGEIDLIDCREEDEWHINRLPGARLVPLSGFGEAPLPEKPAIIYCHHGMRSLRAAAFLRSRGLADSWSMAGGIHRWSEEIDPAVPIY
ncbi:rhodanese-like domain-containing protein [Luteolibacter marinus]|uniref:rhodanese-like domain-containing protein n=1 Tax=Luteolibacter marinus TaxID=2776705 RepID=UPI001867881F|nr:rhodanese-like domain-containing protein [Luteolibacter marinus]